MAASSILSDSVFSAKGVRTVGLAASDRSLWQQSRCPADCERPVLLMSWALALAVACLVVGAAGLLREVEAVHVFGVEAAPPSSEDLAVPAMLEMSAAPAAELAPLADASADQTAQMVPDVGMLPPAALPELDLEEVPVALTAKDLFEVPAAPALEAMLTPEEAPKPTPKPAPKPITQPRSTTTSRSAAAPSGGVPGGTGTSRSGSSKGYFPHPPYPAAARSRGMQGTVYLSVTFGSDGRVTGAAVARSSGYSELDRAASDWVRRHWRGSGGQTGTFRQPIQFRLR